MEALALTLAGIVAPFITNWVKGWTGLVYWGAIALTIVVSLVLAVVSIVMTNGRLAVEDVAIVFSLSQVIYQAFMRKDR